MVTDPSPYTHYRATESATVRPGTYRVVGTGPDSVVVLRVADGDGRRVTDGEITSLPHERLDEAFVDTENPDAGVRSGQLIDGVVGTIREWIARLFGRG